MDPRAVRPVLDSPLTMRSRKSSKTTTGLNNKKTAKERKSTLFKTPKRRDRASDKVDDDDDDKFETSSTETIRDRRGFRPLSVFTNSVFLPLGFDAVKAMEEIEDKQKPLQINGSTGTTIDDEQNAVTPPTEQLTPSSTSKSLATLPFSNNSEVSLRAFLTQPAPPDDGAKCIRGPFSTLSQLPAPDLSQHPAFASDPFTTQSDSPDLVTTSTVEEIRKSTRKTRYGSSSQPNKQSNENNTVLSSANRGNFTFSEQRYDPQTPRRKTSYNGTDDSPLALYQRKHRSVDASSTSPVKPGEKDRKSISSGRLRKISTIFRPRSSTDKTDSPSSPSDNGSPATNLRALEAYLRTMTNNPSYVYAANSWFPRHPNTSRAWKSRNLKCTNCIDVSCACCRRTCCAYKAAVMALVTHKDNPEGRAFALERIQQITLVFPYGREAPTFLQCTRGPGGNAGCGKVVCPDCCGICPDDACADIQCRKCKRDPWGFCDWHSDASKLTRRRD